MAGRHVLGRCMGGWGSGGGGGGGGSVMLWPYCLHTFMKRVYSGKSLLDLVLLRRM